MKTLGNISWDELDYIWEEACSGNTCISTAKYKGLIKGRAGPYPCSDASARDKARKYLLKYLPKIPS